MFLAGGVTVNVLYAALVEDETLKARAQQLGSGIDQVLERLEQPPEVTRKPTQKTFTPEPKPAPEPISDPLEEPISVTPSSPLEPEMILIPAGPFLMGSSDDDKQARDAEKPQHIVDLPEYLIGKYPVTNGEYQAFVRDTGRQPPSRWDGGKYPKGQKDHPVAYVTWHDAMAYCKWLSEKTRKTYRLPTEAEWEKAARGPGGLIYPWGNLFDKNRCNTFESGIGNTTPVGNYSPAGDSPYGVADMAGNVWEWTQSLWGMVG